jgi:hypothetical protein
LTGTQTLLARAALGVAFGASSLLAISIHRLRTIPARTFDRCIVAGFLLSRFALYLCVFFFCHIAPRGDIPAFYWDQANDVLHGMVPYRDFVSSYAPLHPYLDALALRLWHSPLSIILMALFVECLVLPLWLRLGREFFPEQDLRTAALLYLTSTISFQFVTIDGQDNVIIAVLLALAILWLRKQRDLSSGIAVALGSVLTKFLPLIYAPIFFIASPRRWRWAFGLAIPVVLVYGTFVLKHANVLSVLANEGGLRTANNLTYLIEAIFGITVPPHVSDGLTAFVLLSIFACVLRGTRQASSIRFQPLIFGTAAITIALLLFAKKSWPPYLMIALFPICLLIPAGNKLKATIFAAFGIVAVVAPSYWATVLGQFSSMEFHQGLVAGSADCYLFLFFQSLLIMGYAWLLLASVRRILAVPDVMNEEEPQAVAA